MTFSCLIFLFNVGGYGQPSVARAVARAEQEPQDAREAQELSLGVKPAPLAAVEQVCLRHMALTQKFNTFRIQG